MFQCLPFFVLFPQLKCPSEQPSCTRADYCTDPSRYPIDWDSHLSLENWLGKLDIYCESPYLIALMGSMYFVGAITSGLFVTRMADLHGRKWPTLISAIVSIPIHIGLMISTSLTLSIVLFFLFGMTRPGKMQVSFVYISELVPENKRRLVGSFILFFDGSSLILFALYFLYVSKNWEFF